MKNEKKIEMQQQCIQELEKKINFLEQENHYLKQLIPDKNNVKQVQDTLVLLRKEVAETLIIKRHYEEAHKTILILKKKYQKEMDALLDKVRSNANRLRRD